jgi:hypothetical protein
MITLTFSCFLEFPVPGTPDGGPFRGHGVSFFLLQWRSNFEKKSLRDAVSGSSDPCEVEFRLGELAHLSEPRRAGLARSTPRAGWYVLRWGLLQKRRLCQVSGVRASPPQPDHGRENARVACFLLLLFVALFGNLGVTSNSNTILRKISTYSMHRNKPSAVQVLSACSLRVHRGIAKEKKQCRCCASAGPSPSNCYGNSDTQFDLHDGAPAGTRQLLAHHLQRKTLRCGVRSL